MKHPFTGCIKVFSICLSFIILGTFTAACNQPDPYEEAFKEFQKNYTPTPYEKNSKSLIGDEPEGSTEATEVNGKTEPGIPEPEMTTLVTETIEPSNKDQRVSWQDRITVTVPGGLLKDSQILAISKVDAELPETIDGFTPLATYDVSLGEQSEFNQPLTIEMAYDPAEFTGKLPESSISAEWWNTDLGIWCGIPSQVDTDRNVVIINTNHLTKWRIRQWSGGYYAETTHFNVYWTRGQTPTVNSVAQDEVVFAGRVGDYLENAWLKYFSEGLYVCPVNNDEALRQREKFQIEIAERGRSCVVIDARYTESETSTWTGEIRLKLKWDSEDQVMHDTAHELFHTVHLRKSGFATYRDSEWWADAAADYAATRIAWNLQPGMPKLSGDFFRQQLTTADGIHNYEASRFVEYMVRKGVKFIPLFNEMSRATPAPALLDRYLLTLNGKSLKDMYAGFLSYAFFDSTGPVDDIYVNPTILTNKAGVVSAKAPKKLDAATKSIAYQMEIDGIYGADLWGFRVDTGTAPSRALKIMIGQPVTAGTDLSFYVYNLRDDKRVPGGAVQKVILSSTSSSAGITVTTGDVIYILAINASDMANLVEVSIGDETGKPAVLLKSFTSRRELDGGTYVNWKIDYKIDCTDGVDITQTGDMDARVLIGKPAKWTVNAQVSVQDSVVAVQDNTDKSIVEYHYRDPVLRIAENEAINKSGTFPCAYNASGNTITIDFTFNDTWQSIGIAVYFDISYDIYYYDSKGKLVDEKLGCTDYYCMSGGAVNSSTSQQINSYKNMGF